MQNRRVWNNRVGGGDLASLSRFPARLVAFFLLAIVMLSSAFTVHAYPVNQCAADRKGSNLGCNSQDVHITGMAVVGDTTSCVGGSNVTLDLQMTMNFAQPNRYDVGIFVAKDGKDPALLSANGGATSCTVSVLPAASPFLDLNGLDNKGVPTGNTCGDGDNSIGGGTGSGIHYMSNVTVPCQSKVGGSGNLYIPFTVSWDTNAGGVCSSNLDPVPASQSKCNSPTVVQGSVAVAVLPSITMTDNKTTLSSGDSTNYTVVITNTTGVVLGNLTLTEPAVSGIAVNTLSCVAAGGAVCPGSSTVAAIQGSGIQLPDMPVGSSLTYTVNATLTGNPSDTRTNTATVTLGSQSNSASDTDIIVGTIAILPSTLAQNGDKGSTLTYSYTVYNFGASTDNISLSVASSKGWTVTRSPTSVSVAAGGSATVTVTVNIPSGATVGDVDTTTLTAVSGNNPTKTASATAVTTVTTVLTLTPSNTSAGGAGSYVYYNHRVQSNYSGSKDVSLTPSFTSGACTGWTGTLFESDKTTALTSPVTLAANGGYKDFVLKVGIPANAALSSACTATLVAAYTSGAANTVSVTDVTTVKNLVLYEDTGYTVEQYTYPAGNNVYAKSYGLTNGTPYYYKWYDPGGNLMRTSPVTSNLVSLPDTYSIPSTGPLGTWTVQVWNSTTNTIFVQSNFYVGPDHLKANYAGASPAVNTDTVIDLALHDKVNHVVPKDAAGNLVKGSPLDTEGPLMVTVTVSGSAQIISTTLTNATITGQSVTGKLDSTTGTATLTIRDSVGETVTITPLSYKSALYGSPVRDESATVTFLLAPPTVTKAFNAATIGVKGTSTQTITITNPNSAAMYGLAFTDTYPANLKNAATPALSNSCSGTATGTAGGGALSLTGGVLTAGSSCTITVNVTSTVIGSYLNSTGVVSSTNAGSAAAATATLTVKAVDAINSTVVASPTSVAANNSTTSTITVTLKDGAGTVVPGKTVTLAQSGGSTITTLIGTTNASGVATFTVKDGIAETVTYTATDTTDSVVVSQTAQVIFTPITAPTLSKSFSPASIASGGTSKLTIAITNPTAAAVSGLAFTDTYPVTPAADLKNAATPAITNTCGGTVTGTADAGVLTLSGGSIAASGSCSVSIDVTAATLGSYVNTTGAVTSSNAVSGTSASATLTVTNAVAPPNHYELSLPSSSISCLPITATVTACADTSSPCTNKYTATNGTTATLATNGGVLSPATVTFDATGVASASLSYPAAVDGASVSVSLSGEQVAAVNSRQCCPDGVGCAAANSCSTTFNTGGFIFSDTTNGAAISFSPQRAGFSDKTYYLRAVKKSTTTKACESILTGTQNVGFGYECNDPATCNVAGSVTVDGGINTAIASNDNNAANSYTNVSMNFDPQNNYAAPFIFKYSDVGYITLHVKATVNSAPVLGASNSFLVYPGDFGVNTCPDDGTTNACPVNTVDPAWLTGSGTSSFTAGKAFKATITARICSQFGAECQPGAAAPSFGVGTGNATEQVMLTHTLIAPKPTPDPENGVSGSLSGTGATTPLYRSSFSNGVATVNDLKWSEVGVITLKAQNDTFYSNDLTAFSASVIGVSQNFGRFKPDHFALAAGATTPACSTFSYFGQDGFTTVFTLTAQSAGNTTTVNYSGDGGGSSWAKLPLTVRSGYGFAASAWSPSQPAGSDIAVSSTPLTATHANTWVTGSATVTAQHLINRPANPAAPTTVKVTALPVDSDGVTMTAAGTLVEGTPLRYGRLSLQNAYGSELLALPMMLTAEYWNGSSWVTNTADGCTALIAPASGSGLALNLASAGTTTATLSNPLVSGNAGFSLSAPGATHDGYVDVTIASSPSWLNFKWNGVADTAPSARATFGIYKGNSRFIYIRELY